MSLDDPFFVVRDEVKKALVTSQGLYQRWTAILENPILSSKEEMEWTTMELRKSLRSIEWDLEDLEETVQIVEQNPKKYRLDINEIQERNRFIEETRRHTKSMQDHLSNPEIGNGRPHKKNLENMMNSRKSKQVTPLLGGGGGGALKSQSKYMRLENQTDTPLSSSGSDVMPRGIPMTSSVGNGNHSGVAMSRSAGGVFDDINSQQQIMMSTQEESMDNISSSVGVLKNMSSSISRELDEQAIMLEDLNHEVEVADSKLDSVMKKMAKVLHMTTERRQWTAIGILVGILLLILLLFFVL